jgi:hypothetical protein
MSITLIYTLHSFQYFIFVKVNNCVDFTGPLAIAGHSSVVINDKGNKSRHSRMVVISGHSPRYGYVNAVQEFHFGNHENNLSRIEVDLSSCDTYFIVNSREHDLEHCYD